MSWEEEAGVSRRAAHRGEEGPCNSFPGPVVNSKLYGHNELYEPSYEHYEFHELFDTRIVAGSSIARSSALQGIWREASL